MDRHRDIGDDVVLYVCGQAFVGNRGALAAASPYLGSVLAAAPSSAHVTLPPLVPPDVFSALMAGVADAASLRRTLTEANVEQVTNFAITHFAASNISKVARRPSSRMNDAKVKRYLIGKKYNNGLLD